MCGIVGLVSNSPVNQELYDALTMLQHRGQDAAGIMTCDMQGHLFLRKENGLVRDVFRDKHMQMLTGNLGIGHVRYPTAGSASSAEAQPFYVNSPYGLALAHNGNLTNAEPLKAELFAQDRRHINTRSDSEVLLNIFAHELLESEEDQPSPEAIFQAVRQTHERCSGAYAVVMLIAGFGILAFRDPNGIRPLVYGKRENADGTMDWVVASETVVLDTLGFKLERDVAPGEAIYITNDGNIFTQMCAENHEHTPCLFEYVYFARPDSIIDGACVYQTRQKMGELLAQKILEQWPDHDIDAVIPIPDTSRTSAAQLAETLGVRCREGFMKNRYIGRTFIMPGQKQRKKSVRQKLNPIEQEFAGRNVLLVDDSIVRGTTSQEIIQMARDAGAKKVYFASAAPPVRYPNVYGIDMPSATELVAHERTESEIGTYLGADKLFYQDMADLIRAVREVNPNLKNFDDSVFTGKYVTKGVDHVYLNQLELFRADSAKAGKNFQPSLVEMHNNV